MSGIPVFTSDALVLMPTAQGTPLDFLALVARLACVPKSYGTVITRETVLGRLPPARHGIDSRVKLTLNLVVKETYLLALEF